jgi:hypothetical protein
VSRKRLLLIPLLSLPLLFAPTALGGAEGPETPPEAHRALQSDLGPLGDRDLTERPTTTTILVTTTLPPTTAPPTTARPTPTTRPAPSVTEAPAPEPETVQSNGDVWHDLAMCETGMRNDTGEPYWGYFQFSIPTWEGVGETGLPSDYSYEHQRAAAQRLQARYGWGQWPSCSRQLGLR